MASWTLTPDAQVAYKTSDYYAPECDGGVLWNDPAIAIDWPLEGRAPELSIRDQALPRLAQLPPVFAYDGHPLEALA